MAFATYKDLTDAVQRYLDRNDEDTLEFIPVWVRMAEDELDRQLRHPGGEVSYDVTIKAGEDKIPLPINMIGLRSLYIPSLRRSLYTRSLETLYDLPLVDGYPTGFAKVGTDIILNVAASTDYVLRIIFYIVPTKMKEPGDRNMYLIQCSDYLMYYAVAKGFDMLEEHEKSAKYDALANKALNDLQVMISREENSGSTIVNFGDLDSLGYYF